MVELPKDIVEQILIKLNVKDLIRCRFVSKSWKSWISEPKFIKSHLEHSYLRDNDNSQIGNRRIIISDIPIFTWRNEDETNARFFRLSQDRLIGSANGLVCVSPTEGELLVVNPETREVKKLKNPQIPLNHNLSSVIFGFGYDSKIDDYKVVLGFKRSNGLTCFHMLTLKFNIWKDIEEVGYTANYTCFRSNGILFKGSLHWVAYQGFSSSENQKVILSFDLSENKFKEIPLPDDEGYRRDIRSYLLVQLGIMDNCLSVFHGKKFRYNIWVMKKYNVKESWEKHVDPESKMKPEVVHRLKDLKHYISNSRSLCHENCVSQNTEFLGSHLYIPSLVSPHVFRETEEKETATSHAKIIKVHKQVTSEILKDDLEL